MSDPLEQLDRFRSEVQGAPMLSATEIRRRGDRLRRRGNALKTGAAALAVTAVVVPLSLHGGFDHDAHTATDPGSAHGHAVSDLNVMADTDTIYNDTAHWQQRTSTADDSGQGVMPCTPQTLSAMGASSVYRREWQLAGPGGLAGGQDGVDRLAETVGSFASPAAARAVIDQLTSSIVHCTFQTDARHYTVDRPQNIDTGNPDDIAMLFEARYSSPPYVDESGRFIETGLIASGDRVAVVSQVIAGQDFNFSPTPVEAMMPAAARRLVAEPAAPASATTAPSTTGGPGVPSGPTNSAGTPTTIPDDFPIDAGWPTQYAEGPDSIVAPSHTRTIPEFGACGTTLPWPAYEDRVSAAFHNPEDARDRTLTTYTDADAAAAATKAIVDLYRGCDSEPFQPPGYVSHFTVTRTSTSGDSWHISSYSTYNGDPALSIEDIHVIRVGLAVLILDHNNEGTQDSIPSDFAQMNREAAEPIRDLCMFTEAGC